MSSNVQSVANSDEREYKAATFVRRCDIEHVPIPPDVALRWNDRVAACLHAEEIRMEPLPSFPIFRSRLQTRARSFSSWRLAMDRTFAFAAFE